MLRTWGGACAVALGLMGLAGCLPGSLIPKAQKTANPAEEQVFDGSLEVVSRNTESLLQKLHVRYVTQPDGDGLRIQGTTQKDGRFTLFLSREASEAKKSEKVRIRIQWDGGPRESIHWFLFGALDALAPA